MTKDRKWREFEKLIALLELHLGPMGAVVKSPDHIVDRTTGQLREVDASVRFEGALGPTLITIECRDRVSTQDVTWIEQLVTKQNDLGASATIAVSATGFSRHAIAKAKAHLIETRTLKQVTDEAIRNWAEHLHLSVMRGSRQIVSTNVRLRPIGGMSDPPLEPNTLVELSRGDIEYRFIQRISDNKLIGIGDLLRESDPAGADRERTIETPLTFTIPPKSTMLIPVKTEFSFLYEDVAVNAAPVERHFKWEFATGEATVSTVLGPAYVESIEVQFLVSRQLVPFGVGRLLAYDGASGRLASVAQRELRFGDGRVLRATSTGLGDISTPD